MRLRTAIGLAVASAIIILPPYGDEWLAPIAYGAIEVGGMHVTERTSEGRDRRLDGGKTSPGVPRAAAVLVIGAIIILAAQAGAFRGFVQH